MGWIVPENLPASKVRASNRGGTSLDGLFLLVYTVVGS
jgi:hypothetical protein